MDNTNTNEDIPIKGYRKLTIEEKKLMNAVKEKGAELDDLLYSLKKRVNIDQDWLEIAIIDIQKGLMSANRAIAKPTTFFVASSLVMD